MLVALGAALLPLGCGPKSLPPSSPSKLKDEPLPGFRRPTLAGQTVDVEKRNAQVVVVKFFAKYCEPCQKTLPVAQEISQQYPDVLVIGVSEDEHTSDALEQVERFGLTFPVVLDRGNVLAGRFRVTEMPMTFVTDKRGQVVWIGGPEQTEDELRQAVEVLDRRP